MNRSTAKPSPWFHHFWPWFIVVLLSVSVVASLYTVSLAYGLGDLESATIVDEPSRDSAIGRAAPSASKPLGR